MAMRDRAGMTTHKKASPILLLSLIPSSSSAAMNCCSNGLRAFFLRIWTRETRWRNERVRARGDLILIKRRPPPLLQASVLTQRLSYPTETVLFNNITRKRIVLSFKASPRKPLGRRATFRLRLDLGRGRGSFGYKLRLGL